MVKPPSALCNVSKNSWNYILRCENEQNTRIVATTINELVELINSEKQPRI